MFQASLRSCSFLLMLLLFVCCGFSRILRRRTEAARRDLRDLDQKRAIRY